MDLHLKNKIALVTGGSKGIGYAIAKGLIAEGTQVIISSRDRANLDKAVSNLQDLGGNVAGITADVTQPNDIEELIKYTRSNFGSPDILISNAGGPPKGKAANLNDAAWDKAYNLILMANVRLTRAVLSDMQAKGWGRIINITSSSIKQPINNLTLSNAFRAGVTGFAKTLSTEVAADGITVNNVAPGHTATQRSKELYGDETARNALIARIPAKRLATPEEIAAAAVFLASEQAAYITGQTIVVDGGVVNATY
ncbi:3-oxoacyl-(acyl-carrier-protein) reductase FabG [Hyella patelloides LEGE 07179]|uniref:3-oxoacyl-(Acyl-carrier-protein) reductase FabG n=1 Tax=Hyella patelloides LEGE 07179 TaxID=945734 RepID=A0A563VYN5_9CYAN|nr:SDR family oxidoreductase [Hyella patelloides]VEP16373.1 3-oxoacyl-(acyl-carrier-protein) reductase FabG [Hyella patelloides LEGE 07179]